MCSCRRCRSVTAVEGGFVPSSRVPQKRPPGGPVEVVWGADRERVEVVRPGGAVQQGYRDHGDVVIDSGGRHPERHSAGGLRQSGAHIRIDLGPQPKRGSGG